MKNAFAAVPLLLLAWVAAGFADTVKTLDNNSANGNVIALDDQKLVMKARFVGEEKEIEVQRASIKTIEFNSNTFNPGSPRGPFLARPATGGGTAATPKPSEPSGATSAQDTLFLKSGSKRDCVVVGFDGKNVHLKGAELVPRYLIHSIRFAPK